MFLNLLHQCKIPKNIKIEKKKSYTYLKNGDLKIYIVKNRVMPNFFKPDFGKNVHQLSAEEAKNKHLGATKCILKIVEDETTIKYIIKTYFGIEFIESYKGIEEQSLKNMSENDLVDLYRNSIVQKQKDKIFKVILFFKYYKTRTWDEYIRCHVTAKSSQLKNFKNLEINDLYQDAIIAFSKVISKWYNKNEESCFSTYAIRAIDNYTNRVFMKQNKKKRQSNKRTGNEVGLQDNYLGTTKCYEELVSNENVGKFRTVEKVMSFDQHLFYKSLLDYLTKTLEIDEINELEKPMYDEINELIKNKNLDKDQIRSLATKYNKNNKDIIEIKRRILQNREKMLFKDIIYYCYVGLKGSDQILAEKYNRSRAQITKSKSRLTEFCKSKLGAINLTVQEIFERR